MSRETPNLWCRLAVGSALSLGCLPVASAQILKPAREAHVEAQIDLDLQGEPAAFTTDAPAPPAEIDDGISPLESEPAKSAPPEPQTLDLGEGPKTEVITERYPNRTVKIERHVAQDEEGNYFNHGAWSNWDEKGVLRGTGEYRHGKRHGKWVRWFNAGEGKMFAGTPYKYFQPPFVAEATFVDDKLDGAWTVLDSKGRKASEWHFVNGQMHGTAVWYFPTGQKQREATYQHDQVEGHLLEWTLETPQQRQVRRGMPAPQPVYTLVTKTLFINGRREGPHVEYYSPGKKKVEGTWLLAKEVAKTEYDFWEGDVRGKIVSKEGENQRRGLWSWYYPDGGKQLEGEFVADDPVGLHTWWHSNGQKMTEGEYKAGKEEGKWTWWHSNGQKQLEGQFNEGQQVGHWISWNDEGKVVEVQDFDAVNATVDHKPAPSAVEAVPHAAERQPMPFRIEATRRNRPGSSLRR
jgi:antitoxin component YwqK of YwqJK toxin-antitoxin module